MNRLLRVLPLTVCTLALAACGFHLRKSAALPPAMSRLHLVVSGGGDLQRGLTRALESAGVTVADNGGPGIAELHVPEASFDSQSLSQGGYARITEAAVHYHVAFDVTGADGKSLLPRQQIDLQREYSFDATDAVGNAAEVQQIERGMVDDMVQAMMFRLQAAARHAPASAG